MSEVIRELSTRLGGLLANKKLTVATAESCTGGLLGAAITEIPGSSGYFTGGIIAYDNAVKERILKVPAAVLKNHGAVSAETVIAMASGVCELLSTNAAIAVSGIAGPDKSPDNCPVDKPVGLVFIGIAIHGTVHAFEYRFKGTRSEIREQSVEHGLRRLIEHL